MLRVEREMATNGRVHPDCVNAANPYHECGVACLEKISQGKGHKEKKKSDNRNGIKMHGERRGHPSCPKASNPFHDCNEFCSNRTTAKINPRGVNVQSGILETALSFGRKKKGPESRPESPKVVNNVSAVKAVYPAKTLSARSPYAPKKKMESDNSQSFSSSQQHSEDSSSQDHSFDKTQIQAFESVPTSGNIMPYHPESPKKGSFTCFAVAPPNKKEGNENIQASHKADSHPTTPKADSVPTNKTLGEVATAAIAKSFIFTFSGVSDETDEEEAESFISDSCMSVGKYHVKASVASTLQSIFDKHGDIAANCRLESSSMRAYYLECLCSVVQELKSTTFKQLTKSKVKEMLSVLMDIDSVRIDVTWLHAILNELVEAMDLNVQHHTAIVAKANCNHVIESTKKELESMEQDLAQKEKAVADAKAQIAETRARLDDLELECSELSETISSIQSKLGKFENKSLADEIL